MIIANFQNDSYPIAHGATQWNYGEVLRIQGLILPKAVEIHFSLDRTCGQSVTRIGTTKDGVTDVVIPDSLLENEGALQEYFIYAWIYLTNATSGRTEHKLKIKVEARSKPEIPGGDDNADPFREAVKAVRESAERAETAEQQAAEHAKQTKLNLQQTTADRQEVEEMVDSVSGIPEQVETVKGYAEQAKTAATNALLSEQASKQAKESAIAAQAGAETAEDNAELTAQKTEKDKATVEQAKNLVQQMGQEVLNNKNLVDKTAQDFTLTAQQAVADVNNAGQSQTERVQSAGTTAVENIKTAQTAATGAVEATKTEAINVIQAEGATQVGNVTAEGTKQVQAVQNAAQEIIEDREQIAKNATDIADLRQSKADAIVESANGTLINIKDSSGAFFEDFSMNGKTEQMQTTGAQLLNCYKLAELEPKYYSVEQGKLKVMNANGSAWTAVPEYGTLAAGTYTITANSFEVRDAVNNTQIATCFNSSTTFTLDKDTVVKMKIGFNLKEYPCVVDAMLNKGDKPLSYELYTGGKPSPSPEYKQEIVNAGDNGQIEIKVTGKNLIPFPYQKLGGVGATSAVNGVTYTVLKDRGIKFTGKALKNVYVNMLQNFEMTDNKKYVCSDNLKADKNNGLIHYYVGEGQSINKTYYPQIEHGTVATEYEQYKEPQTITLQLDKPITKWDRIEKRDCVWGIVRQGETKVLKAAPEEEWAVWEDKKNAFFIMNDKIIKEGLCSHFEAKGSFEIGKETGIYMSETIHLIVTDMNINSLENWKTWLQANPITVAYKTSKETWEPLPEETQTALNALHTNYPTTIISNSEDCEMEVEYIADTKSYIDKKFAELSTSIVATQKALL